MTIDVTNAETISIIIREKKALFESLKYSLQLHVFTQSPIILISHSLLRISASQNIILRLDMVVESKHTCG